VRARALLIAIFLAGMAGLGFSQSTARSPAGVEPGEPEMLLPKTVLEIEDLSVEKVEAKLPPEEELLPPERKLPMLSVGEMAVGEPALPIAPGVLAEAAATPRDRFLTTDILLGAGMQNRIVGNISLKTMGGEPRFSLLFNHQTADGFAGHDPGQGYSERDDTLSGTLKADLGGGEAEFAAAFTEGEMGLQGNVSSAPALARLVRLISTNASISAKALEWLAFEGSLGGDFASLLESGNTLRQEGFRVSSAVAGNAQFGGFMIGLAMRFGFRGNPSDVILFPHYSRYSANLSLAIELPLSLTLEGSGGVYWNSSNLVLPLFEARITGTPWDFGTISLGAGYKFIPYDMMDILASLPLALPTSVEDDRGWFGDAMLQVTAAKDVSVTARLSFMASERMLDLSGTLDPAGSGLFPVAQQSSVRPRLNSDIAVRWGLSRTISISAGYSREYLETPFFVPGDSLRGELVALDPAGTYGGTLSFLLELSKGAPEDRIWQWPFMRLTGFWKISDAVKLRIDCDDLLWPLIPGGTRWVVRDRYTQPGFRVMGSVGIIL
jgi:hypothetical protein